MHSNLRHPLPDAHAPHRRWHCGALAALAAAWALSGLSAAAAQSPIVIQFSHVVTADTAKGRAVLRFKELAEARTGGKVRVEVYANSTLYKDREELDALRLGAVQMLAPSLSKLAGLGGGDFEVFDLPFLFPDRAAFRSVVDGPIGRALLQQLEPSGVKGLAFWDNGYKVFTANRPLQAVQDFRGLKIRVQASRVLVRQMEGLGSVPSVSPLSEVFTALRDGRLDGQENVPTNIVSQRLQDVQSHLTVSSHGYLAYAVIVNKPFWDKLPVDIRIGLEVALRETTRFANQLAEDENARALEHLRKVGKLMVYTPSTEELAQWRIAMLPVYQESRAWIQPATLSAIQRATAAPP